MSREPLTPDEPAGAEDASRELDRRILRSSGWLTLGLGGSRVLSLLGMLVLVRLLEPRAFGLVALAWTVFSLVGLLGGTGIGAALVYRRLDIEKAAGSAVAFSPLVAGALYGAAFLAAPSIARAFDDPELTDVLRVVCLILLTRSFAVAPGAILERNLDYRARVKSDLGSSVVEVAVSIALALSGAGVWSLVFGRLAGSAVASGLLWLYVPWRPSPRHASWSVLREILRYARWVSAAKIVHLFNNTIDNLLVGRLVGTAFLGFYTVSWRVAEFPITVIGPILGRVMFPVYSLLQDDLAGVRRVYLQNLQRVALLILPLSVGVAVATEPLVEALLGSKWLPAVEPLRILALWGLVRSLVGPSGEIFKGRGKPQLPLAFLVPQAAVIVSLLLLLVPRFGITGAAMAQLVGILVTGIPSFLVAQRLIELPFTRVARALAPSVLCAAILAGTLAALLPFATTRAPALALALLAGAGGLVYLSATALFARGVVVTMWVSIRRPRGGTA